jgi:hypothetical protein
MPDTEPVLNDPSRSLIETRTREYNDFFTKLDQLENNPQTTTEEYVTQNGQVVKKYNLNGTDFAFLSHTVGIGIPNSNLSTSQNIRTEISFWGSTKPGEANNQISCSLISADHISHAVHIQEIKTPQVMLGFTHLDSDQLILAKPSDVGSVVEKNHTFKPNEDNLSPVKDVLKTGNNGKMYNEIIITRYVRDGQVRKPNFIVIFDNQTNDRIEQAIDYFNVPVVNLNSQEYISRSNHQIEAILTTINSDTTLEDLKTLHQKIVFLKQNKDLWRDYGKNIEPETSQDEILLQKISSIEETIIEQQINQNKTTVTTAIEKFKQQPNLESLQEVRTILLKLAEDQSNYPINFISPQEAESGKKWLEQSQQLLVDTLSSAAPDIINFYQNQLLNFSQNAKVLTTKQVEQELKRFFEYSVLSESNDHPRLHRLDAPNKSYDIVTLKNQQKLTDLLNQVFSAQEKLRATIVSELDQSQQKDQQKQTNSQNESLDIASSDLKSMISLFESSSDKPDFKQKILNRIKDKLINDRKINEIIEDVRKYHHNSSIIKLYEAYLTDHFNNETDKEVYRIIANPDQISQPVQEINLSPLINTTNPFQILTITTQDDQLYVFQIDQKYALSHKLKKVEDSQNNQDTLKKINNRWFWRFRRQIPRLKTNYTYELNTDDSNHQTLITQDKNGEWCLITNSSVQKIKTQKIDLQ